jgi:hypothetical protein
MALDVATLETTLETVIKDAFKFNDIPDGDEKNAAKQQYQELAAGLASAIDTFVRSGTVSTTVTTSGTASAQSGTGTGSVT